MYKIGSGTHSAPLAHNKKIKSTALDIRQPAAVQQSISYLTILALLLVFHQDSFQKRAGAEATPRDTSHYHQSYNYSVKYLGKITIVFIHIFKINFLTFFLITSVAIVPASVHSYSICKKKYKMKIYSMQYIVNSTEQKKT